MNEKLKRYLKALVCMFVITIEFIAIVEEWLFLLQLHALVLAIVLIGVAGNLIRE